MNGFSLVTEPWIPVIMRDGKRRQVGLQELLAEAAAIRLVADQSPLVTVAVHQLLLALVYRIFNPRETSDWVRLWQADRFEPKAVAAYLDRYRERFDLFHPVYPFYQVADLPEARDKGIAAIVHEVANGNNPTLFDHGMVEEGRGLLPERAALYLLAYQQFAVSGGDSQPFYFSHGPLTAGYVQQAQGDSLWQTLLLNLIPLAHWHALPQRSDRPAWEQDDRSAPQAKGTEPSGPLGYLTWQSRRIRLVCQAGRVTGCQMLQGHALPESGVALDPFKSYRRQEEKGLLSDKLRGDRAAWQYADTLLAHSGAERTRAGLLDWLAQVQTKRITDDLSVPPLIGLTVSGLIMGDKAGKVEGWRREELPLPLAYFQDESLIDDLTEALDLARRTEWLLRRVEVALTWVMAERKDVPKVLRYLRPGKEKIAAPDSVRHLTRQSRLAPAYWPALEGPLHRFMRTLPAGDRSVVRSGWSADVAAAARAPYLDLREEAVRTGAPWEALGPIDAYMIGRLRRIAEGKGVTESDETRTDAETA